MDEQRGAQSAEHGQDSCEADALVALTAFNAAVIAAVVCCCAALRTEPAPQLSLVAGSGALACIALWHGYVKG